MATALGVAVFALASNAQSVKIPQPSSTQTFTQDFGLGKVSVTYSRPNARERVIFGGLVPFGEIWRTGANNATIITFTDDVNLDGKAIPAGEYGIFTIPGKDEWTVIISKGSKQWGSYTYKEADDLVRLKVKPIALTKPIETFTIQLANVYPASADLQLIWANTLISVRLTTDVDTKVMENIEKAMAGDTKPYFQSASYYYANNKDLKKALEWVNAAEKADQKAPYIKLLKARIQLKAGDKKGAIATAESGLKVANESNNSEYIRLHTDFITEAKR